MRNVSEENIAAAKTSALSIDAVRKLKAPVAEVGGTAGSAGSTTT